jgi:hypothetical protein
MDDEEDDSSATATATGTLPKRTASIPLMAGKLRKARLPDALPSSSTPSRFAMESDEEEDITSPNAAQAEMDDEVESAVEYEVRWTLWLLSLQDELMVVLSGRRRMPSWTRLPLRSDWLMGWACSKAT